MRKDAAATKGFVWGVVACLVLGSQASVLAQKGADAKKPKKGPAQVRPQPVKVVGLVTVTKGKDGKVTAATLTKKAGPAEAGAKKPDEEPADVKPDAKDEKGASAGEGEVYSIVMNRRGKQLADKMDGKVVEAQGYAYKRTDRKTKEEKSWFRVGRFKEFDANAPLEDEKPGRGRGRRGGRSAKPKKAPAAKNEGGDAGAEM